MHPISRTHLALTIIAIVAVVGVVLYRNYTPTEKITDATIAIEPTDTAWKSSEVKKETIAESNQYYAIDAAYPSVKDPGITRTLKTFVTDQIAQFKDDTSWATDPTTGSASEGSLSLDINYREQKTAHVETYIFSIVTYTGGAHGLQATRTFAYNEKGEPIAVTDLFSTGQKGLEKIATFVQSEITKKNISDEAWIKEGAAPTTDNYQNFVVGDDGVTFIFDAYQVAPYAAGVQNILVPTAVFKAFANPSLFK